jgi:hypothetical protein
MKGDSTVFGPEATSQRASGLIDPTHPESKFGAPCALKFVAIDS